MKHPPPSDPDDGPSEEDLERWKFEGWAFNNLAKPAVAEEPADAPGASRWLCVREGPWLRLAISYSAAAHVVVDRARDARGWHAWMFCTGRHYVLLHDRIPRLFATASDARGFIDRVSAAHDGWIDCLPADHEWERYE